MNRSIPLATAIVATAATVAACSSAPKLPTSFAPCNPCISRSAALAYLLTHPVPARPGMTAGIVMAEEGIGSSPVFTWDQTLITRGGLMVTIACGRGGQQQPCGGRDQGPVAGAGCGGGPGTYEYFRPAHDASSPAGIQVIKYGAVCP